MTSMRRYELLVVLGALGLLAGCTLVRDTSGFTDGEGSTDAGDAQASDVDVADAGIPFLALDTFSRTVASGLGAAEIGGAWNTSGQSVTFSVSDGAARLRLLAASSSPVMTLAGVLTDDADLHLVFGTEVIGGAPLYVAVLTRRSSGGPAYAARLAIRADGSIDPQLAIDSRVLATGTSLPMPTVSRAVHVRAQARGTSPTTLRMKVWERDAVEPAAWQVELLDATPELQAPGSVGVTMFLSSSATNAPYTVTLDDFTLRPASRTGR